MPSTPLPADFPALLSLARDRASDFLAGLPDRHVGTRADHAIVLAALGGDAPLNDAPRNPASVIDDFATVVDAGLVATPGPRHFGFVIGGVLPAALAADWLTSAWDQNAFSYVLSPAAAAVEEVLRRWLADLLGFNPGVSLGIVTGATMANFTGLATARHAMLERAGWNVEEQGLFGAPPLTVITSDESHVSLFAALQMLGLGRARVTRVEADEQGRLRLDRLAGALEKIDGPLIVCAQAGNVNTGAFDPLRGIAELTHERGGWLHVDGAFGGWAAASQRHRHLTAGLDQADSVGIDGHKWLNVPYDCGFVFTRHPAAHSAAMTLEASYYVPGPHEARSNGRFVPEASRRARAFPVYAALRSLGRSGVEQLVDRCCALARRMADRIGRHPRVRVVNDVVINQVLVRFTPRAGGSDERAVDECTASVIRRIQQDGTCWAGGADWHGMHAMRISVSNWSTTEADIDRSADAMLRCLEAAS